MKRVWTTLVWLLLTFSLASLLTGCAVTGATRGEGQIKSAPDVAPEQGEGGTPAPKVTESRGIDLQFSPLSPMEQLEQRQALPSFPAARSISWGRMNGAEVTLHLYGYLAPSGVGDDWVSAFLEHSGKFYYLGPDVANSYGLDDTEVQAVNWTAAGEGKLRLVGAVGTPYTAWQVVGYDEMKEQWLNFRVPGRPQVLDLDRDGEQELVAIFGGAHLNLPDVYLYRWHNNSLEEADLARDTGNDYAKLLSRDGAWVIEGGSPGSKPHFYRLEGGRLEEQATEQE